MINILPEIEKLKTQIDELLATNPETNIGTNDKGESDGFLWFKGKTEILVEDGVEYEAIAKDCPVQALEYALSETLISSDGQAMFNRHKQLNTASKGLYRIVAGEQDSWGWLSGVLITPKGRICYG